MLERQSVRTVTLLSALLIGSCQGLDLEPRPVTYSNDRGMDFVMVLADTVEYRMGSPRSEPGRTSDETQHKVRLTTGLYVQTTEVTQDQWTGVMGSNPSFHPLSGDHPVERLSWYEAVDFCNRISAEEDLTPAYTIAGTDVSWDQSADGYRLPTEAEWEYLARGSSSTGSVGRTSAFANGDLTADPDRCDFDPNLNAMGWYCGNAEGHPHPVGHKAANDFDLHDMHGNVWEWCWDWKDQYQFEDEWRSVVNPTGPASSSAGKVIRGGGAYDPPRACRSANRDGRSPDDSTGLIGVRVVRSLH